MRLVIVSGLSGSGKTIALRLLEDLGFYCTDNLPLELLSDFAKTMPKDIEAAAVGIDARTLGTNQQAFHGILETLRNQSINCDVLFLSAANNILLKRFSETRRKHPLTNADTSLAEAIEKEKMLLEPIEQMADLELDTSHTNVHQLRDLIKAHIDGADEKRMSLQFLSFGFKHGTPNDADFIFDIRCLPNPHWIVGLRQQTGQDNDVKEFLESQEMTHKMFDDISHFVENWANQFEQGNRNYLTIAIGCTGGQHRSVYMAERLHNYFTAHRDNVLVRHRDKP